MPTLRSRVPWNADEPSLWQKLHTEAGHTEVLPVLRRASFVWSGHGIGCGYGLRLLDLSKVDGQEATLPHHWEEPRLVRTDRGHAVQQVGNRIFLTMRACVTVLHGEEGGGVPLRHPCDDSANIVGA